MADIHANREAFEACLRDADARGVDQKIFLGDYVGYGADPSWVVERVMALVEQGALALLGNHDAGVAEERESMNSDAETVMAWTRGQLGPAAREFLAGLPLRIEDGARLYVHANVPADRRWGYIDSGEAAGRALGLTKAQATFCGHVHRPMFYSVTATSKLVTFKPVPDVPVPVPGHRRHLAVLGSVGQPRDGVAAAGYALLDTARDEMTFLRVPYDVETATRKIRAAGLPETLALRLEKGE